MVFLKNIKIVRYIVFFLLVNISFSCFSKTYRTEIFNDKIKSLQVISSENWDSPPIIELRGNDFVEIKFDELSHEHKYFTYTISHCNADWTLSNLTSLEFLQGFQNMTIDNYISSFNTTMPYTNYKIFLPNENAQFKISGNYVVEVFPENGDKPILSACFSVVEPAKFPFTAKFSSNTDIDFNKSHQQLSFNFNCKSYNIISPQQELKIFILQNNRTDNMVKGIQPSSILNGEYSYYHNRNLIFEAGNEYRRFEMTTTAYRGSGIEELNFHSPFYHVTLFKDEFRSGKSYIYDQDQNGKYLVRCVQGNDYDAESDYFFVHFSLDSPEPLLGRVYIQSEIFNNILDNRSEMIYNRERKVYEKTVLLKQGLYNYIYILKESSTSKGSTAMIEGNYFETENEYLIFIYHRPLGERYDRLIGVKRIKG